MKLAGEQWEALQAFAEKQRQMQKVAKKYSVFFDSDVQQTLGTVAGTLEHQHKMAPLVQGTATPAMGNVAALAGAVDAGSYTEVAGQASTFVGTVHGTRLAAEVPSFAAAWGANSALLGTVAQLGDLSETVSALQKAAITANYSYPQFTEPALRSFQSSRARSALYENTVDPYEPVREEIHRIQWLLAQYLFAATADRGELSTELSEAEKKAVRLGLAAMVGMAAGLPGSFIVGFTGVALGVTLGGVISRELDSVYDIKQRQQYSEESD